MFGFGKSAKSAKKPPVEPQAGFDFAPADLTVDAAPAAQGKQRWVQLGNQPVPYALKRSTRRSIGFSIGDAGLTVTAPRWSLVLEIEAALKSKQHWILTKLADWQIKRSKAAATQQRWAHGELLPYLGKHIILNVGSGVSRSRLQHGMFEAETLHLALNEDASERQIKDATCAWLQAEAKRVFAQRIPFFEAQLSVKVASWQLTNASTRWGSATSTGTVRLHWRLVHFAPDVIDYVIAHELAHLREMNHSAKFWSVVESVIPDYASARQVLKKHSLRGMEG